MNGLDPSRMTEAQRDVMRTALGRYERAMRSRMARELSDRVREDATWRAFVAHELLELLGE